VQSTIEPALPQAGTTLTNGQLAVVTVGRLGLNTAYRLIYPLQPFLAQRLEVDLQTVSALVTVQVLAAAFSPLGGYLADTRGERRIMTLALALFCLGAGLCALAGGFGGFLLGYALIGLASALYQPSAQAYISARTSYARRGRALGVYEISWAASALVGVAPLMWLVQATGDAAWSFGTILVAALCSLALVRFGLPPLAPHMASQTRLRLDWRALRAPGVLGMLALLFLTSLAVDLVFVVQGAWNKASLGAREAQLGQVVALLGIAEFGGAIGSTLLVDRLGKKRTALLGYSLTALCVALLPLSDGSWQLFLPLYFLFGLCIEFSIVSALPLASGVAPAVRGTVMALCVLTNGMGRAVASRVAAPLWLGAGIWATGLTSAALIALGVLLCWALVREREDA
jgi:MFS transporter, DHA1 family, inner membrane transport protein